MHGQTVCISFPAKVDASRNEIKLTSDRFYIDRTDWGIYRLSPQRPYPDDDHGWTVPDTVAIKVDVLLKSVR
jgi:hypothetical protein